MSDESEEKVIDMNSKISIEALIKKAQARAADEEEAEPDSGGDDEDVLDGGVPSLEKLMPLPQPGDPYKARARPSSKPLPTLFLLKNDGTIWSYPYACRVEGPHLVPAGDAAGNLVVVLKFSGITATEVTLTGRKLEQLVNQLGYQRIAWLREQAKGKISKDADQPVITGIVIKDLAK
jgi:hypothetical protein